MTRTGPLVVIGLDAAELLLIEELCAAGELPALQELRANGCFGALESSAALFPGGVWPTFYTAREVPWHGIYHSRLWNAETMQCETVRERDFPARPFWECLDARRYRVAVLDVPMVVGAPRPLNGVHLAGWGTHDLIRRGSWPADLWRRLASEHGGPRMPPEDFGPQRVGGLRRLRRQLLEATEQMAAIGEAVLTEQAWDLFILVLGSPHRGGHYLWDLSQVDCSRLDPEDKRVIEGALREIYRACDITIARLLEKVPSDSRILVFSPHGMGRNPGWSDFCGEILARVQADVGTGSKARLTARLNRVLPRALIRPITRRLPEHIQERLVTLWYGSMLDPTAARAFPLLMDQAGYIRINLKGRERRGIVERGAEYEALRRKLAETFLELRDLRSAKQIVGRIYDLDELAPPEASCRDALPDLVITWDQVSAIDSTGISSQTHGELHLDPAGRLPSGRAGNHRGRGWYVAVGEGIQPGSRADGHQLVDLVPLMFHWLGAEQQEGFQGRPIPALTNT